MVSSNFPALLTLEMGESGIDDAVLMMLAKWKATGLRQLVLSENPIEGEGVTKWITKQNFPALKMLSLGNVQG